MSPPPPSLPETYRAVVITEANSPFTLRHVPLKAPGEGELLVKVLACGVCFTDVAAATGEMGTHIYPRVPGHEIVGDVVQVGAGVTNFKIGARVGGAFHAGHDSTCRACQRGRFQQCENEAINAVSRDGGFAEYVLLRSEAAIRVPAEMDPAEAAPLLCAGVTVFNGIRKQHIEQGGLVAVQGLGGLGHLAVQYARKMGYEVAVLSSGDDKAAFAKKLGAHHYINSRATDAADELNKLGGADLIVMTAGAPKAVPTLVRGLAPGGTLLTLAAAKGVELDFGRLIMKGARIQGWLTGGPLDCEEAVKFALQNDIHCMIERYKLDDVQKAVEDLLAGKPRFRNVLVME